MTPSESKSIEDYFCQKRLAYLPDAVSLTTIFGEFVAVNDGFCKATGYARDDLIGKNWGTLDMWVDHTERSKYLEELGKLKSVKNFKTKLIHADGSIRDCRLSGVVVGINGKQYVLTIGREIQG
jgi:PAS domain S-box-containing protein